MFEGVLIGMQVVSMIEEEKAFNRLCDSLPEDKAGYLRNKRHKEREKEKEHREALEIADAGRARNFWGN